MPTQSTAERLLASLHTLLSGAMPPGAKVLRNAILPERVPAAGVVILRDGGSGPPEVRCVTDIRNLIELSVVHPGTLTCPDMRTISCFKALDK
ncbi:MAG: hypothetical protein H5U17_09615 [Defluviimonas sp.]|nr:hypothetical protein [Defluviimonas sp.]